MPIRRCLNFWFLFINRLRSFCSRDPLFNDSLCDYYLFFLFQNRLHINQLLRRWCRILNYKTLIKTSSFSSPLWCHKPELAVVICKRSFATAWSCFKWLAILSLHLNCPIVITFALTAIVSRSVQLIGSVFASLTSICWEDSFREVLGDPVSMLTFLQVFYYIVRH